MSLTALFLGSKIRHKIICEKSKIYKNSRNALEIQMKKHKILQNDCLVMGIGWKNALFIVNYVI
jgi:hypothetical protein